jgi:Na+/H+ antiporter NhaD/arsenite permease-like protein
MPRLFRGSFDVDAQRVAEVMLLEEREAIQDTRLLIKCGLVLLAVFIAFVAHPVLHIEPSIVAMLGAGVLILISRLDPHDYLSSVEWETLLFFAGLFIMVGALVKTGVIDELAALATQATGGNALVAVMLILGVSAPVSGIVNTIPYVAAMGPIVNQLAAGMQGQPDALWWALTLGADFGGNLTAVGASANVVMLGIASRADNPISFWEFARKGAIVTAMSIALSAPYLWLRYFVLA